MQTHTLSSATKETVNLSLPLIGFRLVSTINGFLAMLLIATLGQLELAASALITTIQITLNLSGWSIIFAIAMVVSHAIGQGKTGDLGKILRQGWILSFILSIPMTIIFWNVGPILRFFHQQESLVALTEPYFHTLSFGVLPGMLFVSFLQLVVGTGKPRIVFYFSLINIVFLLAPGYLLMFGKFGLPRLGIVGMAYANVIVSWLSLAMGIAYLLLNPHYKTLEIFKLVKEDFYYLKKILQLGVPMMVHFISEFSAFSFSAIMVGWLGQVPLAALQIVNQLNATFIMIPFGIAQASSVLIGRYLGQDNKYAIKLYSHASLLIGIVFAAVVTVIYLLFPKTMMAIYSVNITDPANAALIQTTIWLFAICAISQLFDSIRNIATGILRGFHDTATPMWVGVIASWGISIPLGYLFGFTFHWGIVGLALGFLVAWLFSSALLVRRVYVRL